jgi:hypothetical protein
MSNHIGCRIVRVAAVYGLVGSLGLLAWTATSSAQDAAKPAPTVAPTAAGQPATSVPLGPPEQGAPAKAGLAGGDQKPPSDVPAPTVTLKPGEMPTIKFDTQNWDFGKIAAGEEVAHDFWFTTTGTGPLEILKVKPGCGCTTAGAYDRIIQPGESGRIPLKMHTARTSGKLAKSTQVFTNIAGEGATIQIQILGETWLPIDVQPRSATLGRLSSEQAAKGQSVKLTVTNNLSEPAKIDNLKCTNPAFKADVRELTAGKTYELTIALAPAPTEKPYTKGNLAGAVTFSTGLADSPTMDIPVNVFITADVEVTPESLVLTGNRTAETKRPLVLRNNSGKPVKVSELTATNPAVKVTLEEMEPGTAYRVNVDIPATYTPAPGDKIVIKTDNSVVPELNIPITGAPAPQAAAVPAPQAAAAQTATPVPAIRPAISAPSPTAVKPTVVAQPPAATH